jgi:hypothetical protein
MIIPTPSVVAAAPEGDISPFFVLVFLSAGTAEPAWRLIRHKKDAGRM